MDTPNFIACHNFINNLPPFQLASAILFADVNCSSKDFSVSFDNATIQTELFRIKNSTTLGNFFHFGEIIKKTQLKFVAIALRFDKVSTTLQE